MKFEEKSNSNISRGINNECPKFAWIIMACLGCLDIIRGILHTIFIEYAAPNIMGLDLSVARDDQLLLMGSFGISNYITGLMLLLIAFKGRNLVEPVFLVIPGSYIFGMILISRVAHSTSKLGGAPMMMVYIGICIATFIGIQIMKRFRKKSIN